MTNKQTSLAHSPSPWEISKQAIPGDAQQYGIYSAQDAHVFCIVQGPNAEVNANLIAAAPELLEACQTSLEDAEAALNGTWDPSPAGWHVIIKNLSELIAKAQG